MRVAGAVLEFELGQVLSLEYPRFGLDAGKNVVVKAITENWRLNETTLELWG